MNTKSKQWALVIIRVFKKITPLKSLTYKTNIFQPKQRCPISMYQIQTPD